LESLAYIPSVVVLGSGRGGGQYLIQPLHLAAVPSVSYAYNDLWFNVTVTAAFSFDSDATVSEAAILVERTELTPVRMAVFVYDDFDPVYVPAGSQLTVQWVFAWKDYGAFTENWGRLWQYALQGEFFYGNAKRFEFVNETGHTISVPFPPQFCGTYPSTLLQLAWGDSSAPPSRTAYRLVSERGSVSPGVQLKAGIAITGTLGAAREVGLYWLAPECFRGIPLPRYGRVLLMRWVPQAQLPPSTPVTIYIARSP